MQWLWGMGAMTTVAVDASGHWIAADGLVCAGSCVSVRDEQKIRTRGNAIYAMSGTTCMFEPLIQWHQDGAHASKVPPAPDAQWSLLVITRDSAQHYGHLAPYAENIKFPWTTGSGHEYALGALKAGASAEEAVRIACEIDIHSGGEIQVVNIREALGMAPRLVEAG